jgi:nitrous oxide reductase accessory protein NosL
MIKKVLLAVLVLSSLVFAETYHVSKDELGLIRKVKVYKEPKWIASIKVRSGKEIFFCSPKSMFEFYHIPGKWPEYNVKADSDMRIYVTDFVTLEKIEGRDAFYVYGSTSTSPAGDDFVAFKTKKDAQRFADANHGKRIFPFKDVSSALVNYLNGNL